MDTAAKSSQQQWEVLSTRLKEKRAGHGAVVIHNNRILLTGGYNGNDWLSSVEIINTNNNTSNTTTTFPDLPTKRSNHASVVVNDDAYVIGGSVGSNRLNTVQRIRTSSTNPTPSWENVAAMNERRNGCAAAVHRNTIYVFGGVDETGKRLSSVEVFNTTTGNCWVVMDNNMATPRRFHSAVMVGDTIYIIGGTDDQINRLDSVEIFNTTTQSFSSGPPLPIPISSTSAVAVGRLIVISGGYTTDNRTIAESYILDTGALQKGWRPILDVPLTTPRRSHTAVVVENNIYICGGYDGGNYLDTIERISFSSLTGIMPNGTYSFP